MFKRNTVLKVLCIIPYVLCIHVLYLISEPVDTPAVQLLVSLLTHNSGSSGGAQYVIMEMENLGYLILFNILFGNQISDLVKSAPAMRFSRIRRRDIWFWRESGKLLMIAGIYNALYVGLLAGLSIRLSIYGMDMEVVRFALRFYWNSVMLLMISTLLLNLFSVAYGTPRGFLIIYAGIVFLLIISTNSVRFDNFFLQFINPFCSSWLVWTRVGVIALCLLYMMAFVLGIAFLGGRYLQKRDVL